MIQTLRNIAARKLPGPVTRFNVSAPLVALTFDDGPDPVYTPKVLEVLGKFHAGATFFMVGRSAEKHPDLVKRVASEGHAIGNHSWSHLPLNRLGAKERRHQIRNCQSILKPYADPIFRPPWGFHSRDLRWDAFTSRLRIVNWSLDVDDWWDTDSGRMAESLSQGVEPGDIILLHDAIFPDSTALPSPSIPADGSRIPLANRDTMIEALGIFLEKKTGELNFVTIPAMMHRGKALR